MVVEYTVFSRCRLEFFRLEMRGEIPVADVARRITCSMESGRGDAHARMMRDHLSDCRPVEGGNTDTHSETSHCSGICGSDFSRWRCSRASDYIDLAGATGCNTIVISSHSYRSDQTAQQFYFAIFDNVCDICSAFVTQMQIPRWRGKHLRNHFLTDAQSPLSIPGNPPPSLTTPATCTP